MEDELMPRPSVSDLYVQRRASELYMPLVREYFGGRDDDEAETVEQLMKIVRPNADAYQMVRGLEKLGWYVGEELIDVMRECADHMEDAIRELTWQWVRCLNIQPAFKVGDIVMLTGYPRAEGEIVGIDERQAKYHVHTAEQNPTAYWVVEFEKVRPMLSGEVVASRESSPAQLIA